MPSCPAKHPQGHAAPKRVLVILRRPPEHPRTAQGLRAAVGYAAVGLRVQIACVGPAQPIGLRPAAELPPLLVRPRQTLLALGSLLVALTDDPQAAARLSDLAQASDVVVCW